MTEAPDPNTRQPFQLRPYRIDDAQELLNLFRETVCRINSRDYDREQIRAWASEDIDVSDWAHRFEGRFVVVAELSGRRIGFGELDSCGHLDRFYVSADHQRQGVGRAILNRLLLEAKSRGLSRVDVDASLTALPFFESLGFTGAVPQTVHVRGVDFLNFRLEHRIS